MNLKIITLFLSLTIHIASLTSCANAQNATTTDVPKAIPMVQRVEFNLDEQTLTVTEPGQPTFTSPISSGRPWMPTPTGNTCIGTKQDPVKVRVRPSSKFGGDMYWCVPLGFTENGTSLGVFTHEGTLYDPETPAAYPASHGCIRLPKGKAKEFYDLVRSDARVNVHGNSMNYFQKYFAGAKLLRFDSENKRLLGWKWQPSQGPNADFVELAEYLNSGKLKGYLCYTRKDGTDTSRLNELLLGFEFFGGPKDSPNIWELGIPVTVFNQAVDQFNATSKDKRLRPFIGFKKRS